MTSNRRQFYEQLVHAHSGDLYRFAYRLCGEPDIAEDLVQETFVEAWRSIRSLRDDKSARAWLYQILRHRFAHWVRRLKRTIRPDASMDVAEAEKSQPGPDVLTRLADEDLLQQALNSIDERFKEPFLMVFLEGLTCAEAAEKLDIPRGTVLSRIHRARLALREFVDHHEQADRERPHSTGDVKRLSDYRPVTPTPRVSGLGGESS